MRKSAASTVLSVAGPLTIVLASGGGANLSIGAAILAGAICGVGWLAGLWLTRHPLLYELFRAWAALLRMSLVAKLLSARASGRRR